jgi:hypothetical protein
MVECLKEPGLTHKTPDLVFVRPRQARMLHSGPAKIVLLTLREVDRILTQLALCKSRTEFAELRKKVFPDYANLAYIMANTFSIPDDPTIRQEAIRQAFQNIERLFETDGVSRLGREVMAAALFCVSTLKRAYRLVGVVHARGDAAEERRESDRKLATQFNASALLAQMHLDCLRLIITRRTGVSEGVLEEILLGMRSAVRAYAYVRGAVEIRTTREPYLSSISQDGEDRELLAESFLDYAASLDAES